MRTTDSSVVPSASSAMSHSVGPYIIGYSVPGGPQGLPFVSDQFAITPPYSHAYPSGDVNETTLVGDQTTPYLFQGNACAHGRVCVGGGVGAGGGREGERRRERERERERKREGRRVGAH